MVAAYLVNLAFVAGGAVLCRDPHGQAQLELVCDHGHCETVTESEHDHDSDESCWCSACPCEDTFLGSTVTATLNRDEQKGRLASAFDCVPWYEEPLASPNACTSIAVLPRPPPGIGQQLRQLRTIVLIV